jgi:nucleotide-binding universal stress UspA family protein
MTEPRSALDLKRLLVATDLSPRAEKALARAAQVADEHRALNSLRNQLARSSQTLEGAAYSQ